MINVHFNNSTIISYLNEKVNTFFEKNALLFQISLINKNSLALVTFFW